MASVLDRLGTIYLEQQRYPDAEATFLRALAIRDRAFEAPDILLALESIVALYRDRGAFTEAKKLRRRVLEINERAFAKTEGQYKRELADKEETLGPEHLDVAEVFSKLADFYHAQGRLDEAESAYKRKLALHENASRRAGVGESLEDLAQFYADQGRPTLAKEFRNRSWELSSPYCYRPEINRMTMVGPKWAECSAGEVFVSRSEYEEWKTSKEAYRERLRERRAAE